MKQANILFLLIVCVLGVFLWKTPFITQDGVNHKKVAVLLSRLSVSPTEAAVYENTLNITHTNVLFPLVYQKAATFLTPDTYEKLFVGFFLVLFLWSVRLFLRVWSPENKSLWVMMLPFCFHPLFMRGMYNFLASIPLTLLAFTILRQGLTGKKWYHPVLFLLCCCISWMAHPFPFIVLSIGLATLAFTEFRKDFKYTFIYGLILFLFLGPSFLMPLFQKNDVSHSMYVFSSFPVNLAGLFIFDFMDYSIWQFLMAMPFFLLLLFLMWCSSQGMEKKRFFWMAFLAAYFFFPRHGSGGSHINERFLIFIWCFLLIGLPVLSTSWLRRIRLLSIITFLGLAIGTAWGMKKVDEKAQEAAQVLEALPSGARLYPINFDLKGPSLLTWNLAHIWTKYDDKKEVYSPYLFAFRNLLPLARRLPASDTYFPATEEDFPAQVAHKGICKSSSPVEVINCASLQEKGYERILQQAMYYDYWFLHQPSPDFKKLLDGTAGLEEISHAGDFSLYYYRRANPFLPPLQTTWESLK